MRIALSLIVLASLIVPPALAQSPAPDPSPPAPLTTKELHAMVVGIGEMTGIGATGDISLSGFPISSGPWGTDYITSSHALRIGARFGVTEDGRSFARSEPVATCSSNFHRIDAMVFRATTLPNRRPLPFAAAFDLKTGDEIEVLARKEFNPSGEVHKGKILGTRYLDWLRAQRGVRPRDLDEVHPRWHDTMVATAFVRPGFSGSPWVRGGTVVGLTKGGGRLNDGTTYALGETLDRVKSCLELVRYQQTIPGN